MLHILSTGIYWTGIAPNDILLVADIAKLRAAFDKNDVTFQTAELGKVDAGGGGTIAYIMGNYGMNVIDSGVAVLNMHAPWEITSKIDIYEAYRSYKVFLKEL